MDEGGDAHRVLKTRLNVILSNEVLLKRLRDGVDRVHNIVSNAYDFGKVCYIIAFERHLAEAPNGLFSHDVASSLSREFPLTKDMFSDWLTVVSTDEAKRRGRPCGELAAGRQHAMYALYAAKAQDGMLPPGPKPQATNLSYPLGDAADGMRVAYENNVVNQFDSYVRRFVKVHLGAEAAEQHGVAAPHLLPMTVRAQLTRESSSVSNAILKAGPIPQSVPVNRRPWIAEQKALLMPPPPARATAHWRFDSRKRHPEQWLPYMIYINRMLEALGAKVFSPLPLRTQFVPCHMRLDTQGLFDLLIHGQSELSDLKQAMEEHEIDTTDADGASPSTSRKYKLPGLEVSRNSAMKTDKPKAARTKRAKAVQTKAVPIVHKNNFMLDLATIVSADLVPIVLANPVRAAAHYRTCLWQCITKLGRSDRAPLEYNGFVFNNVIDTDGFSVSLHYVSPELHGLTRFNGGFKTLKAAQRNQSKLAKGLGAQYVTDLPVDARQRILSGLDGTIVSGDPGKGVLLHVTDGKGNSARYTAAQRRRESKSVQNQRDAARLRRQKAPGAGGATYDDLMARIGYVAGTAQRIASGSCMSTRFAQYLRSRREVAPILRSFFGMHSDGLQAAPISRVLRLPVVGRQVLRPRQENVRRRCDCPLR